MNRSGVYRKSEQSDSLPARVRIADECLRIRSDRITLISMSADA